MKRQGPQMVRDQKKFGNRCIKLMIIITCWKPPLSPYIWTKE